MLFNIIGKSSNDIWVQSIKNGRRLFNLSIPTSWILTFRPASRMGISKKAITGIISRCLRGFLEKTCLFIFSG
jgi:hypothetical protein